MTPEGNKGPMRKPNTIIKTTETTAYGSNANKVSTTTAMAK